MFKTLVDELVRQRQAGNVVQVAVMVVIVIAIILVSFIIVTGGSEEILGNVDIMRNLVQQLTGGSE